jgi:hypothetical protein
MLFANLLNVFLRHVPTGLRHNQGDVLRPLDFPAPMFQFLIGVSLVLYLGKRSRQGSTAAARLQAMRRFTLLLVLGVLLDSVGALRVEPRWGVLQTLAEGGLLATLLASASDPVLAALAVGLLALFSGTWNGEVHSGPLAALAFVPLTLGGVLVGRGLESPTPQRSCALRAAVLALGSGALAAVFFRAGVPFNKVIGTSSFVALAVAVSAAALGVLAGLEALGLVSPRWLVSIGQYALNAWVLQYVLVFYPAWLIFPGWRRLGFRLGLVVVVATTSALAALAVALGRRGFRVPI